MGEHLNPSPNLYPLLAGMHYNSVRMADDYSTGPPAPIVLSGTGLVPKAEVRGFDLL